MNRDVESGGHRRPRFLQPLGEGFWPDVKGALGFMVGAAIGALLLDTFDLFFGAAIGATIAVILSAVGRRLKRRGKPGQTPTS